MMIGLTNNKKTKTRNKMVNNVLLFYGIGAAIVLCIMIVLGLKIYFFSKGITLIDIAQGIFFSLMSWSFFIVCILAAVIGILEKMKIEDKVIIKGKKYNEYH